MPIYCAFTTRNMRKLLVLVTLAFPSTSFGQVMYKCATDSGDVTYTGAECPQGTKQVWKKNSIPASQGVSPQASSTTTEAQLEPGVQAMLNRYQSIVDGTARDSGFAKQSGEVGQLAVTIATIYQATRESGTSNYQLESARKTIIRRYQSIVDGTARDSGFAKQSGEVGQLSRSIAIMQGAEDNGNYSNSSRNNVARSRRQNPISPSSDLVLSDPEMNPMYQPSSPPTSSQPLLDVTSGTVMPRSGEGYVDPRDGTFHHDVGSGVVNTKTGEFSPFLEGE